MTLPILFICAYLLGSIPFGLWVGFKIGKLDLREHGSKNIGATNAFRVVGKKWGLIVLALDALKGYGACTLSFFLSPEMAYGPLLLGIVAILGHTFPIWLKFKGGKGVATSLGVFLAILPLTTGLTFGVWVLVFYLSRIVSLASILAGTLFPLFIFIFNRDMQIYVGLQLIGVFLAAFMVYTHRTNISRILKGEEKKLI